MIYYRIIREKKKRTQKHTKLFNLPTSWKKYLALEKSGACRENRIIRLLSFKLFFNLISENKKRKVNNINKIV